MYDFQIQPFIGPTYGDKSFTFDGVMNMHLLCKRPARRILFHGNDIKIDESKIEISSVNDMSNRVSKELYYNKKTELYIAKLNAACIPGEKYILKVVYSGNLNQLLRGFYRSSYVDKNGVTY